MGGNVFHTTATRLTTPQLLLLLAHTKRVLSPYFSALEITRFLSDKETHGDLDVICGLWTGGDGWKGANEKGTCPSNPSSLDGGKYMNIDERHDWSRREVREFCELLAEKLGARKWEKNGMEASFMVPCSVIDKDTTLTGVDDFYQIDLLIHHPPNVGFAVLTQSYGVTALLFAAAVRRLSSSFTCHNDRFVIRYSPYNGLKAIEIELTHDAQDFMDWAGLDSARFQQGFKSEDDYFMWLTCQTDHNEGTEEEKKVKYDSLLEKRFPQGWKKMAGRKKEVDTTKMPRGHGKIRLEVMARFRDWLLTTACRVEAPVSPKETLSAIDPSQAIAADISTLNLSDKPVVPPAKPVLSAKQQNLLDPDNYQVLSPIDISALEYFSKKTEWETAFEGRKGEARLMAERQKRNAKENAESHKAKQEARQTAENSIGVKDGAAIIPFDQKKDGLKAQDMDEGVSL